MAHELKPWKKEGCTLSINIDTISQRETFSREINEIEGENGALNADYRTAEAIAIVSNVFGKCDLRYGVDFVMKTARYGQITLDFRDEAVRNRADIVMKKLPILRKLF